MEGEVKALKEELFRLCWFMRGGITLEEAYQIDVADRLIINEIIKDNLETTKESGMPFF
jgi:hypothetical protein